MIASIDDRRQVYGVEPICKVLPIAPSTYHAHAGKRADMAKLSAPAGPRHGNCLGLGNGNDHGRQVGRKCGCRSKAKSKWVHEARQ
jgi:hypothetical protein